jgi:hypothetical protein
MNWLSCWANDFLDYLTVNIKKLPPSETSTTKYLSTAERLENLNIQERRWENLQSRTKRWNIGPAFYFMCQHTPVLTTCSKTIFWFLIIEFTDILKLIFQHLSQ